MIDWPNARVLVTGGAGFLGSFVVERLHARGAKEIIVPRSNDYDLVDGGAVRGLLATVRPDIVFHLAARVGGIGANRENPATFFYQNAMMGIQLLHECCVAGVHKFIACATACAYPRLAHVPFRETELWNGYPEATNAPYGIAKRILSVQSGAYRDQHGFDSIVVYPTNIYGPRDNFELCSAHVVPAMIRKFIEAARMRRSEVVLWGDGTPTRELMFVEEGAEGLILASEKWSSSEPINLGSGQEVSIRALADTIAEIVGYAGRVVWDSSKPNGQPRRLLDAEQARRALGFECRVGLDEGLRRTLAWYLEHADCA